MTNEKQEEFERYQQESSLASKQRAKNIVKREDLRVKKFRQGIEKKMVGDLIRVFHHPQNPHAGTTASRQRYRDLGHYSETLVSLVYGTHEEFQRAAGLRDQRGTSALRLQMARAASELSVQEYVDEYVKQDWGWDTKPDGKLKTVAIISDIHSDKMDPMVLRVWLDVLEMIQPDGIMLNGDGLDNVAMSQHPSFPSENVLSFGKDIEFLRNDFWLPSCGTAPHAWKKFNLGNHEHTAIRTMAKTSPQILGLDTMNWATLFDSDRLGIEMCMGSNSMATSKRGERQLILDHKEVLYGCYTVTHGKFTGRNAADLELRRAEMSGTSGHLHRYELFTHKGRSWTISPMAAGFIVGKGYSNDPWTWTMGFLVVTIDTATGRSFTQPVVIYEDGCSFNGRVWRPTQLEKDIREAQWNG